MHSTICNSLFPAHSTFTYPIIFIRRNYFTFVTQQQMDDEEYFTFFTISKERYISRIGTLCLLVGAFFFKSFYKMPTLHWVTFESQSSTNFVLVLNWVMPPHSVLQIHWTLCKVFETDRWMHHAQMSMILWGEQKLVFRNTTPIAPLIKLNAAFHLNVM